MIADFGKPLKWAKKLFKNKYTIDQFISSPALRAKTTAELFAAEYDRKMKEIRYIPSLYHARTGRFFSSYRRIQKTPIAYRAIFP